MTPRTARTALIWFVACLIQIGTAGAQGWTIDTKFQRPRDGVIVQAAVSTNDTGLRVAIFRSADKRARILLSLPKSSFDRIVARGRMAAIRADSSGAVDIGPTSLGPEYQPWTDGINLESLIWHGESRSPTSGTLRDILDGRVLYVRLIFQNGRESDSSFPLTGASKAIATALGIDERADPETARKEKEQAELYTSSTRRCSTVPDRSGCIRAFTTCSAPSLFESAVFKACLAKQGWPLN